MSPGKNWSYRRLFVMIVSMPVLPIYAPFRMTTSTSRSLLAFFSQCSYRNFFYYWKGITMPAWVTISFQSLTKCWKQRTIGTFCAVWCFWYYGDSTHLLLWSTGKSLLPWLILKEACLQLTLTWECFSVPYFEMILRTSASQNWFSVSFSGTL